MKVNFYLRKPEAKYKKSPSLIILQVKHKGVRYWWSTGESVQPKNWDKRTWRVKNNLEAQQSGEVAKNSLLDDYARAFREAYYRPGAVPSDKEMRDRMDEYEKGKTSGGSANSGPSFHSMLQELIDRLKKKADPKLSTIVNHEAIQKHLVTLAPAIEFDDITEDWWESYVTDLRAGRGSKSGIPCGGRTIKNDLGVIKRIMEKALRLGLTKNEDFKDFNVQTEDAEHIALTEAELKKLESWEWKKTGLSQRLDECRDLCIVAAYTGYRISDFKNINRNDIVGNSKDGYKFKIRQQKTKATTSIPAHPAIVKIFSKYGDKMLPSLPENDISAERRFRKDVKDVCKLAGLTEKGILQTDTKLELWEACSPHTFRRTFYTIEYEKGILSTAELMQLSGKKSETGFFGYIKPRHSKAEKKMKSYHESLKSI